MCYVEFPKGPILGTILFILPKNDMCNVSTLLESILFADDTNLFYSGKDIDLIPYCKTAEPSINHQCN